ncbi:MAG: GWxTD domain-containing protein, partial [Bacteroidota bacterium]
MRSVFLFQLGKTNGRQNWRLRASFGILLLSLLSACTGAKRVNTLELSIYDRGLYVPYTIGHTLEDSHLLMELPSGRFSIEAFAFLDPKIPEPFFIFEQDWEQFESDRLQFSLPRDYAQYLLKFTVREIDNGKLFSDLVPIRIGPFAPQNLVIRNADQQLLLYSDVQVGEELFFEAENTIYARYFPATFPAAYPPFAESDPGFMGFNRSRKTELLYADQSWRPDNYGMYYLSLDPDGQSGRFIHCFNTAFPDLTNAYELIEALRYITKNKEYEAMIQANDP